MNSIFSNLKEKVIYFSLTAIISTDYPKGKCIYFSQLSIICTIWEHWQEQPKIHVKVTLLGWDRDMISWSKKNCYEEQVHKAVLLGSNQTEKPVSLGSYPAATWMFVSAQSAQSFDCVPLNKCLCQKDQGESR